MPWHVWEERVHLSSNWVSPKSQDVPYAFGKVVGSSWLVVSSTTYHLVCIHVSSVKTWAPDVYKPWKNWLNTMLQMSWYTHTHMHTAGAWSKVCQQLDWSLSVFETWSADCLLICEMAIILLHRVVVEMMDGTEKYQTHNLNLINHCQIWIIHINRMRKIPKVFLT